MLGVLLSTAGCNAPSKPHSSNNQVPEKHYSIVIDAGSSGSRIYVYQLQPKALDNMPEVTMVGKPKKFKPGISAMATDQETVMQSIAALVEHAKQSIDSAYWGKTPLYLMATAGMRLVEKQQQEKTMHQISSYLTTTPFAFKKAMIISGQFEGLYGWIAANYLDDQMDPNQKREALVEMGGASTQVAHVAATAGDRTQTRTYRGEEQHIYAFSYLGMGSNEAIRMTAVPECYPVGYPISDSQKGTGDCAACAKKVAQSFAQLCDSISYLDCLFGEDVHLDSASTYLAVSGFYYTFKALDFADTVRLDSLHVRGSRFCGKTWEEIQKQYDDSPEYLSTYCFNSSYYGALLGEGYHLKESTVILSTDKVNNTEVSWTLGAAIDLEMGFEPDAY